MGQDFEIFKLTSFEAIVVQEYYSTDTYLITNPPEMIGQYKQRVSLDQDVYSFGMTLAILEIGVATYIKDIEKNKTVKNHQRRYFNKLKKKIIDELIKLIGIHKERANIFVQFLRWMKMVILKKRVSIDFCIDLVCVIDSCLQYDKENRPNIHQVVQKLKEIHKNYKKENYQFKVKRIFDF